MTQHADDTMMPPQHLTGRACCFQSNLHGASGAYLQRGASNGACCCTGGGPSLLASNLGLLVLHMAISHFSTSECAGSSTARTMALKSLRDVIGSVRVGLAVPLELAWVSFYSHNSQWVQLRWSTLTHLLVLLPVRSRPCYLCWALAL